MSENTVDLRQWLGNTETTEDLIGPTPYKAMAATLDYPPRLPAAGEPLPPLWHWLYFLPIVSMSQVGTDGHPQRGAFMPPVPLPRRMWASSQFTFHQPLRVGDAIRRVSSIADITEKHGRSGHLVFVKVRHDIYRGEELAMTEHQIIVYREEADPNAAPPPPVRASQDAAWSREITANEVLLFRYSALTFNGHRIHYDRKYAMEQEHYAGLVVHGQLIATLLLDLLQRNMPGADLASFSFKAVRPLIAPARFTVAGTPGEDGKTIRLWSADQDGLITMEAEATLR